MKGVEINMATLLLVVLFVVVISFSCSLIFTSNDKYSDNESYDENNLNCDELVVLDPAYTQR